MSDNFPQTHVRKRVLVTGGNGFLGSWCVTTLLAHGHFVRATVRSTEKGLRLRKALQRHVGTDDRLEIVVASLEDSEMHWHEATRACDTVLHVASPFPSIEPKDPNTVLVPALQGTLTLLRASERNNVRRFVYTSSSAAAAHGRVERAQITESDWSDVDRAKMNAYMRSKTITERAVWDFESRSDRQMEITSILPATMLGPVLCEPSFSVSAISNMLDGTMPAIPRLGYCFVDVRDVASLHELALLSPRAVGERFLTGGTFLWLSQLASILRRREIGAEKVPVREAADGMVRLAALFNPSLRNLIRHLGEEQSISSEKVQSVLDWSRRPIEETIVDCARSLQTEDGSLTTASTAYPVAWRST